MIPATDRVGGWLSARVSVTLLIGSTAALPLLLQGFRPLDDRSKLVLSALSIVLIAFAGLQLVISVPEAVGGVRRWRAGPWFLLWGATAFGFASLTWLGAQHGSANRIMLTSVVHALDLVALAVLAWIVGYTLGVPRWLRHGATAWLSLLLRGSTPALRGGGMPWVLYTIGTVARLSSVALSGHFGYVGDPDTAGTHPAAYSQLLSAASNMAVFGIALAAYRAFSTTTRGSRVTLWTLVGVEAVMGALAGGKESFIVSLLAVLIPYGAVRGRLPLRILFLGAVVLLLIVVPFNTTYREVVRRDQGTLSPSSAVAAAPAVLSGTVHATSPGDAVVGSATALLYRIREVDSVAIITQLTPSSIPYESPADYATAPFIGVVPRALWPGKPLLDNGYQFSQHYYGLPSSVHTSTGITPMGDLYRHGGWPVMICGMVLLGGAVRLFDTLFRPESDPRAVCFVLVFLPVLVKSELDVYGMIASLPSGIVTAAVGAHLMCRGRTMTRTVGS